MRILVVEDDDVVSGFLNGVRVPVLILSARRSVDDRITGLRTGGDDYLIKPFAFFESIASHLYRAWRWLCIEA